MLDKQRLRTFVLGGLAGALAGILFAPRSGKELRGTITSRAGEARERGRETYFDAQERMQERVSRVSERPPRSGEPAVETYAETHAFRDDAEEPFPHLEPAAPGLDSGPLVDPSTGVSSGPAALRDVSWDAPRSAPRGVPEGDPGPVSTEDPEELRRRIQETRSRLRARLEGAGDTPEDPNV